MIFCLLAGSFIKDLHVRLVQTAEDIFEEQLAVLKIDVMGQVIAW